MLEPRIIFQNFNKEFLRASKDGNKYIVVVTALENAILETGTPHYQQSKIYLTKLWIGDQIFLIHYAKLPLTLCGDFVVK